MSASDESMKFLKFPKMSLYTYFGNNIYKKLVMTEFCNDYNLPNLTEKNAFYKIPQNQIRIDLSQTADG